MTTLTATGSTVEEALADARRVLREQGYKQLSPAVEGDVRRILGRAPAVNVPVRVTVGGACERSERHVVAVLRIEVTA